jgi:hypothetical protein
MTARRLAGITLGTCLLLALGTLLLLVLGAGVSTRADSFGLSGVGGLSFVVASLTFATVGALITTRVPGNPIGPIFLVTGVALGAGDFAFQYADRALFIDPGKLPGGSAAAWLQNLGLPPSFGLLALAVLLFPDGRLPSRRWRRALGLALAGIVLIVVGYGLRAGPLDDPFQNVRNPLALGPRGLMDALAGFGWLFMAASVGLAALAMSIRLRRSRGVERQQLKWLALAAAVAGLAIVADAATYFADVHGIEGPREVLLGLGFCVFPIAAGQAILRHRLYDIDVVVNRALVYGALTATLAAAYVGSVLLLQLALSGVTGGSGVAVATSTLAVAGLFRPARERIQDLVDQRFYRRKYDAQRTLESFGARVRDEVALDELSGELRAVVAQTMQPAHVSLWLREASR